MQVLEKLKKPIINVIDLQSVTAKGTPRVDREVGNFTDVGKECRRRAIVEMERRFCASDSENITDASVITPKRGRLACLLDPRTFGLVPRMWTDQERTEAKDALYDEYVKFGLRCDEWSRRNRVAIFDVERGGGGDGVGGGGGGGDDGDVGTIDGFGVDRSWSDEECSGSEEDESLSDESALRKRSTELRTEAVHAFAKWKRMMAGINFRTVFPDLKLTDPVDVVKDLRKAPLGAFYQKLIKEEDNRRCSKKSKRKFGLLPLMATHSIACVCALASASFCERINSMGKHLVNKQSSCLDPKIIDMLVTLRMNKKFHKFLVNRYAHLSNEEIVVELSSNAV